MSLLPTTTTPSSDERKQVEQRLRHERSGQTGNVSRMRPSRRATISAREGSPSLAGNVADISTPIDGAAQDHAPS